MRQRLVGPICWLQVPLWPLTSTSRGCRGTCPGRGPSQAPGWPYPGCLLGAGADAGEAVSPGVQGLLAELWGTL